MIPGTRVMFEAVLDPKQNGKYRAKIRAGGQKREAASMAPVSERIYVRGLPAEISDEQLLAIFSQYGSVATARKLPPSSGKADAAALIKMLDLNQAKWIVENMNGPPMAHPSWQSNSQVSLRARRGKAVGHRSALHSPLAARASMLTKKYMFTAESRS